MTREAEVTLARSATPEDISGHATVKILTASGYKVTARGDNVIPKPVEDEIIWCPYGGMSIRS